MSELLLDSLEIKGYRCFEHLTIEKLGRVNLIVGKNNVGKTTLLEALWIYVNNGDIRFLSKIVRDRGEGVIDEKKDRNYGLQSGRYFSIYRHLFYNRPITSAPRQPIKFSIGAVNRNTELVTTLASQGSSPIINSERRGLSSLIKFNNYFVRTSKLEGLELVESWRNIELRISEDFVIHALKIIAPELISVRLTEYPEIDSPKIPIARVKEATEPVSLSSLGEGMNRLFALSLALANCSKGVLLIDEIESGLHYSILPDVWKLIFRTAKELNVQVFATTHSKDCVEAFAAAAAESPEDGMLIRLERHGEKIVAKTIEEERLIEAVNYEVEVR
jgi:AAA15 family ATPase/GTPase